MRTLLTLTLLLPLFLTAQEFAPVGAQWYFPETYAFSPSIGLITAESIGDTTINSLPCKIVEKDRGSCFVEGGTLFFHQREDSIFYYNETSGLFDLHIIFDAVVGDEWTINRSYVGIDDTFRCVVDSISHFYYGEEDSLRIQHVSLYSNSGYGDVYNTEIIEKVGFTRAILAPLFNTICDGNFEGDARCYSDAESGIIHFTEDDCELTQVELEDQLRETRIYPNPASNEIRIDIDSREQIKWIEIYSLSGELLIHSRSGEALIDVSNLPAGPYFVKVIANQSSVVKKLLIQ